MRWLERKCIPKQLVKFCFPTFLVYFQKWRCSPSNKFCTNLWTGNFSNVLDQIELIPRKTGIQIDLYSHMTHYKQFIFPTPLMQTNPAHQHRGTTVTVARISGVFLIFFSFLFCFFNLYVQSWCKIFFCFGIMCICILFCIKSNNSTSLFLRVNLFDCYLWMHPGLPHDLTSDKK